MILKQHQTQTVLFVGSVSSRPYCRSPHHISSVSAIRVVAATRLVPPLEVLFQLSHSLHSVPLSVILPNLPHCVAHALTSLSNSVNFALMVDVLVPCSLVSGQWLTLAPWLITSLDSVTCRRNRSKAHN